MSVYRPRIADIQLKKMIRRIGAVLIQGPKWCGKTTTAEQIAASKIYLDDPEKQKLYRQTAELNIVALLQGDTPRLMDEWQLLPQLWDAVRFEVDHRKAEGQFILTGSAVPPLTDEISHTGTGRFARLTMRTMSLLESGDSTGSVSLRWLFEKHSEQPQGMAGIDLDRLAFLICRGGWPNVVGKDDEDALALAFDYYDAVMDSDISRIDGVRRNAEMARRLTRSLARHQGAQVSLETIRQDMAANDEILQGESSFAQYINALKGIFVVDDMPAWNPNLRSKTAIRTMDTRYFNDPSIAAAALGVAPADLTQDLRTMGLMFETLAVRDLRVYAGALDGRVYHFRDKSGLECDAVVHLRNGDYGLVEIKLGGDFLIEEGVKTLNSLEEKIDTGKMKAPSFKMVLTGVGEYPLRRKDGVYVVPIGCFGL
ncbi:MAG: ATP-binding protein [Bacteroidales bacterium]|jgi:predicted AAA+ superfamily ATPase|nr:ATP-binding protein [Bacteroidales bacterium]MBQ6667905.1 ATP-binding protein [Bacteroidales bacterium]MBR4339795.1 ATP-binding protein [Bacteroidales bacterium]MBR4512864.1 ATP-binding protein [Bacteroidales bacterium]MBR6919026.1 ATP-binding protein [Bacteroidales bacterium]